LVKSEVRRELKSVRNSIDGYEREILSKQACDMISSLPEYATADLILLYHPFGSELNVRFLADKAVSDGKQIAIPCMDGVEMRFLLVPSFQHLPEMLYDLPYEHRGRYNEITDFSRSICVVPALAVDKAGIRIGYGKGCYDRFLSGYCGISVCAVFTSLFVDKLPAEEHDITMDIAVIPGIGIKRFK